MGDDSSFVQKHDHLMFGGQEKRRKLEIDPAIGEFTRRLDALSERLAKEGKRIPRSPFGRQCVLNRWHERGRRMRKSVLIERWRERRKPREEGT